MRFLTSLFLISLITVRPAFAIDPNSYSSQSSQLQSPSQPEASAGSIVPDSSSSDTSDNGTSADQTNSSGDSLSEPGALTPPSSDQNENPDQGLLTGNDPGNAGINPADQPGANGNDDGDPGNIDNPPGDGNPPGGGDDIEEPPADPDPTDGQDWYEDADGTRHYTIVTHNGNTTSTIYIEEHFRWEGGGSGGGQPRRVLQSKWGSKNDLLRITNDKEDTTKSWGYMLTWDVSPEGNAGPMHENLMGVTFNSTKKDDKGRVTYEANWNENGGGIISRNGSEKIIKYDDLGPISTVTTKWNGSDFVQKWISTIRRGINADSQTSTLIYTETRDGRETYLSNMSTKVEYQMINGQKVLTENSTTKIITVDGKTTRSSYNFALDLDTGVATYTGTRGGLVGETKSISFQNGQVVHMKDGDFEWDDSKPWSNALAARMQSIMEWIQSIQMESGPGPMA